MQIINDVVVIKENNLIYDFSKMIENKRDITTLIFISLFIVYNLCTVNKTVAIIILFNHIIIKQFLLHY